MTVLPPLADSCPGCHPGDHPAVSPLETVPDRGSIRATYVHPVCGTRWRCWWDPAASGWPSVEIQPSPALQEAS